MESWQKLVVKPGLNTAMGPLLIIVSIYSISWENLIVTLLFMCVTIPSAIYFMMSAINERLVVHAWGIAAANWRGKVKKARFEEITVIEVCNCGRGTMVSFFAGDILIAKCQSEEENFSDLLEILRTTMPEKIKWS